MIFKQAEFLLTIQRPFKSSFKSNMGIHWEYLQLKQTLFSNTQQHILFHNPHYI